ncbi:PHP domain-containing protein [Candidatus Aerophobetes bacterium]|uniref:PHP domain-containing protein n=1 Tax=Aerophobetes bacterium TaxID=2030807 RepID=A0A7V5LZN4_UNCAE|nr:PHP domain-containing protein [Candidatus Aerophobetes bacterium]HHF98162.1 PHP domain-containing protein [Candidatus Aerophobetes bacterium]
MEKIDLHIHTVYSDGTYTPGEVVKKAKEIGLVAISITDHDSVEGVEEALQAGREFGVEVVPGVEMSSDVDHDEIHILGYYLDFKKKEFLSKLDYFQKIRIERNERLFRRLEELGMPVSSEEVLKLAPKGVVSRLHIARCMVEKKYVSSIDEAFEEWLNPGKPAYVERERISPFEVINLILEAEGVPVFAHPFLSRRDDLIPKMIDAGLMGIEVYHSTHDEKTVKHYMEIAKRYDLLITGGSDCHGEAKDEVLMGKVDVPVSVLWELKKAKAKLAQRVREV